MGFSAERLLTHRFAPVRQSYSERDVILYALGLGLGSDPTDQRALKHLLEDRLVALPTFAVTLGSPGLGVKQPEFEIDWVRLAHAGQQASFAGPLSRAAAVISQSRIIEVSDRGARAGALVKIERTVSEESSGRLLCTLVQTLLLRGNGGYGGESPSRTRPIAPEGRPGIETNAPTSTRAALIYRLSGDWNPLHADPAIAGRAGFERPILHGLASYGVAGVHVAHALGRPPSDIARLDVRFAGAVYPGDTLSLSVWPHPTGARFRAHVGARLVLDDGDLELRDPTQ